MEERKEQYAAEEIRGINLEIDCAELTVETAAVGEVQITARLDDDVDYESSVCDGKLSISCKYHGVKRHIRTENLVRIEIVLPEEKHFTEITMETGAGNIDMRNAKLWCDNLDMEVGAGNVKIGELRVEEALSVTVGAGNAELYSAGVKKINVDCGAGEFRMQGTVAEELNVDCGVGKCDIALSGRESDYNYSVECAIGSVSVNGNKIGGLGGKHDSQNANASGRINVSCGIGKVKIKIA